MESQQINDTFYDASLDVSVPATGFRVDVELPPMKQEEIDLLVL